MKTMSWISSNKKRSPYCSYSKGTRPAQFRGVFTNSFGRWCACSHRSNQRRLWDHRYGQRHSLWRLTKHFLKVKNISSFIRKLKDKGIQIVGTSDRGSDSLYDVNLNQGTAIVLGSEGWGLRKITGELCDCLISIPMAGKVDCLNVSVSAGVCLYETVRQRL